MSACDKDSSRVCILPIEERGSRTPGVSCRKLGNSPTETEDLSGHCREAMLRSERRLPSSEVVFEWVKTRFDLHEIGTRSCEDVECAAARSTPPKYVLTRWNAKPRIRLN